MTAVLTATRGAPQTPSSSGRGLSAAPRPQARSLDAVWLLSLYAVLLFVLPAHLIVAPLGAVGTPAFLVGMACAWWWMSTRLNPTLGPAAGSNPVRVAVLTYGWFMVLASAVAHLRPLTELELTGTDRALLDLIALCGVALIAADGIASRERLETLLRRVVAGATFLATLGAVQFFTGFDAAKLIRVPGLSLNHEFTGVIGRSIFHRPAGTALHPIEFGVVLGALLPLALHFALDAPAGAPRNRRWVPVWLIAAGIAMSLSRSAVVATVAGGVVLAAAWGWRRRANAAAAAVAFCGVMWALVPGLMGTIRGLFFGLETDLSIQARLDRIPRIIELFSQRPWFGRGLGTFSADDYFLIDNEWYVSAIEVGAVGVTVIVLFILTAISTAWVAGRDAGDPATRQLGAALAASLFAFFAAIGTFDAFFYRIFTGLMFLLIGCAGALWRLERAARTEPGG